MNEVPVAIRSETLALDAVIQETVLRAQAAAGSGSADTMVFLGNRHQSFPTAVVKDPVLEPVDKLVWMVIMLAVRETGGNTAFPRYESIGKLANVSSRSTIARAIAILRATRWLTLCARVRKVSGRFRGNVYALHDEPLPLADALHLDSEYMGFLSNALAHGHARVRAVAQGVLDSIDEDIQAGQDICAQLHPIEQRMQSVVATKGGEPRRFFSFTKNIVGRLRSDSIKYKKGGMHHDQNSNAAGDGVRNSNAQKSNSSRCSSYINKTTTTHTGEPSNFALTGEDNQPLVYPARLCDNHRKVAARYLSALAPEQRQPVLDELEGRFRAEEKGMKPVYDEISFLYSLCKLMRRGDFQPNLGIKVLDVRLKRKKPDPKVPPTKLSQPSRETDEQRRKRMAAGKAQIDEMRTRLGMNARTGNQGVTDES
jgi:Helix-turn-helix domain